jgi:hypothetical protein
MATGKRVVGDTEDTTHEAVLVLVFTKGTARRFLSNSSPYIDVELLLINTPPPMIPSPGLEGLDQHFDSWKLLGVHIDRIKGVESGTTRFTNISSSKHTVLCIPLTKEEYKSVIEFLHEICSFKYNHWDAMLSRTASLIPLGVVEDVIIAECHNVAKSITCLHSAQLVALIFRQCLDPKRTASAKLWGFNSRLITANDIFEQLRVTCMALDANSLAKSCLQALSEGSSHQTRRHEGSSHQNRRF